MEDGVCSVAEDAHMRFERLVNAVNVRAEPVDLVCERINALEGVGQLGAHRLQLGPNHLSDLRAGSASRQRWDGWCASAIL